MNIRDCTLNDAKYICNIYNYYIAETAITFEVDPVSEKVMSDRITDYMQKYPWLVVESDNGILSGYAYAKEWSARRAYKHTVEISIYIDHQASGHGYGAALYKALLTKLYTLGFHTAIATITMPNDASVKFHMSFGFKKVSHFEQTGRKFNQWIDVEHWQVMLKDFSNI